MFLIESGMIGFIGGVAGTILSYIISFGMNNMTMIVYGLNTLLMKLGINATIDLSSLMGSSDSMYYGGGMYMSDSGSGTVMSIILSGWCWLPSALPWWWDLLSGIVPRQPRRSHQRPGGHPARLNQMRLPAREGAFFV